MQRHPLLAIRPGDDVDALARVMSAAHQRFLGQGDKDSLRGDIAGQPVRQVVLDSWRRSLRRGLHPDSNAGSVEMTMSEFAAYRSAHPMARVRPLIGKLLVEDLAEAGILVAISDEKGQLLWIDGDARSKDRACRMNFTEGADWSERGIGTNALGTALELDRSVQLFGAEHFSHTVHRWSCSAAPVHDPSTGLILGTVDITGGPRAATPEVLTLVRVAAAAAESSLRLCAMRSDRPLLSTVDRLVVLGPGPPHLVRGLQRTPLSQRHAEILLLLGEHGEGMTSDRLAVMLTERELEAGTIRTEIYRLRCVVGSERLASKPYRLTAPLISDVHLVGRALDRGDFTAALALYRGPVLPYSVSPGIADIRQSLCSRIQAARAHDRAQRHPGVHPEPRSGVEASNSR